MNIEREQGYHAAVKYLQRKQREQAELYYCEELSRGARCKDWQEGFREAMRDYDRGLRWSAGGAPYRENPNTPYVDIQPRRVRISYETREKLYDAVVLPGGGVQFGVDMKRVNALPAVPGAREVMRVYHASERVIQDYFKKPTDEQWWKLKNFMQSVVDGEVTGAETMKNPGLKVGDRFRVVGFIMLKGLDDGNTYQVVSMPKSGGRDTYQVARVLKGNRLSAKRVRHFASDIDMSMSPNNQNRIEIVATGKRNPSDNPPRPFTARELVALAGGIDADDIARRMGAKVKGEVKAGAGYFGALQLAAQVRGNPFDADEYAHGRHQAISDLRHQTEEECERDYERAIGVQSDSWLEGYRSVMEESGRWRRAASRPKVRELLDRGGEEEYDRGYHQAVGDLLHQSKDACWRDYDATKEGGIATDAWLRGYSDVLGGVKRRSNPRRRKRGNPPGDIRYGIGDFVRSYIVTALWSSTDESDESGGEPLDDNYDEADIEEATFKEMVDDCEKFQRENGHLYRGRYNESDVAHDFWLTRNGHGSGFWDGDYEEPEAARLTRAAEKFGEYNLYVGDDGQIYGTSG